MDILELVPIINELKRNKADKETIDNTTLEQGYTYKNWRKKINKLGYMYVDNQFIKQIDIKEKTELKPIENNNVGQVEIENKVNESKEQTTYLNEIEDMKNEIKELKDLILSQQSLKRPPKKSDVVQKSIRVSNELFKEFLSICKENKIKKVNAFNRAIELFIETHTK